MLFQIREEHPLLVNKQTAVARKHGFPEVIMPGENLLQTLVDIVPMRPHLTNGPLLPEI